jgi:hypothetical protein
MADALNPYMAGRQMGVGRQYAPIQSGGGMSAAQFMAANQANALTPRQTMGRNVEMIDIDPAVDIRRTAENNRLDLRARMDNDARARDARLNREFQGKENEASRALQAEQNRLEREQNLLLQERNQSFEKWMQSDRQNFQGGQNDLNRAHEVSLVNQRLQGDLQKIGIQNDFAEKITILEGDIRSAQTDKELEAKFKMLDKEIEQQNKDLDARISMFNKEQERIQSEGAANRKSQESMQTERIEATSREGELNRQSTEKINSENNNNRLLVERMGQLGQMERLKEELTFKREEMNSLKELKKAELDDKYSNSQAFGATVARQNERWDKWDIGGGRESFRRSVEDQFFNEQGIGIIAGLTGGTGAIDAGDGKTIEPMKRGRDGKEYLNPLWVSKAKQLMQTDNNAKASYYGAVTQRVNERESSLFKTWSAYQDAAARNGIPVQSVNPLTPNPTSTPPIPNKVY